MVVRINIDGIGVRELVAFRAAVVRVKHLARYGGGGLLCWVDSACVI